FSRKQDLLAACLEGSLNNFDALIALSSQEADPAMKIRRLLAGAIEQHVLVSRGQMEPCILLPALTAQLGRRRALTQWLLKALLQGMAAFFDANSDNPKASLCAQHLLEQCLWADVWLSDIAPADGQSILSRMSDILLYGLLPNEAARALGHDDLFSAPIAADP